MLKVVFTQGEERGSEGRGGERKGKEGRGKRREERMKLTSSLSKMRPSNGLDMDHWFRHSSNIIIFSTVDNILEGTRGGLKESSITSNSIITSSRLNKSTN